MYVRHEGHSTLSFIPEDTTKSAMTDNVRDYDPTKRARGVLMLPVDRRADALLREFLAGKLERCDKREKALIRTFLKAINAACAEGNPAGVMLAVRRGMKPGSFEVYGNIRGVGRVGWLPMLVTQSTDALKRIFKETSPHTLAVIPDRTPARDPFGERRAVIPPRVEMILIPGTK